MKQDEGRGAGEGTMPSQRDIEQSREETDALPGGEGLGSAAASALGSAMLGLDQALRREPPAQVVAAEHQPERDASGGDGDFVIELPPSVPARRTAADDDDRS